MMQQFVLVIHFLLAFGIIGLVLLQHGKGAEVGASFGSGASQTLFGSQGSTSFLAKLTAFLAIGFAITSLSLSCLTGHHRSAATILEQIEAKQAQELPLLPGADAANDASTDAAKSSSPDVSKDKAKDNGDTDKDSSAKDLDGVADQAVKK